MAIDVLPRTFSNDEYQRGTELHDQLRRRVLSIYPSMTRQVPLIRVQSNSDLNRSFSDLASRLSFASRSSSSYPLHEDPADMDSVDGGLDERASMLSGGWQSVAFASSSRQSLMQSSLELNHHQKPDKRAAGFPDIPAWMTPFRKAFNPRLLSASSRPLSAASGLLSEHSISVSRLSEHRTMMRNALLKLYMPMVFKLKPNKGSELQQSLGELGQALRGTVRDRAAVGGMLIFIGVYLCFRIGRLCNRGLLWGIGLELSDVVVNTALQFLLASTPASKLTVPAIQHLIAFPEWQMMSLMTFLPRESFWKCLSLLKSTFTRNPWGMADCFVLYGIDQIVTSTVEKALNLLIPMGDWAKEKEELALEHNHDSDEGAACELCRRHEQNVNPTNSMDFACKTIGLMMTTDILISAICSPFRIFIWKYILIQAAPNLSESHVSPRFTHSTSQSLFRIARIALLDSILAMACFDIGVRVRDYFRQETHEVIEIYYDRLMSEDGSFFKLSSHIMHNYSMEPHSYSEADYEES